ncbi:hypothetical protein BASA81_000723 [Batrachochytrium salamandrivorans]|nr:hypothetical protein BASA81_000723 [Batrachochytrium salamandrivorans]
MGALLAVPMAACSGALAIPGMIMSTCCCCLTGLTCACTCVNCLTCCCTGAMGRKTGVSPRMAKLFYLVLLVLCMILATLLRFNSYAWDLGVLSLSCSSSVQVGNEYVTAINETVYCKGDAAVYRISFILVLFFSAMLLLSLISERAHRGFWGVKLLLLAGGIAGSFFLPETQFNSMDYAWFARIASFGFLVVQILILIDFAYQWNESWVNRAYEGNLPEPTNKKWLVFVLLGALIMYLVCALGGFIVLYLFYSSCEVGMGMVTWTVVAVVIMTGISLFREQLVGVPGAILPAGVVSAYVVFLCWSALESNSDESCRPLGEQSGVWSIVLGCLWAIVTLLWATYTVTGNAAHLVKAEPLDPPPETAETKDVESGGKGGAPVQQNTGGPITSPTSNMRVADEEDEKKEEQMRSGEAVWPFHLIMLCASAYLAMLLTDWGAVSSGGSAVLTGDASMWAKFAAQLSTILLFTWTLIAPGVLRGRDFS